MSDIKVNNGSHWYLIYTHPKQEKRAEKNLIAWTVKTFAPKLRESGSSLYTGKTTYAIKQLFPRYIFAKFSAEDLLSKIRFTRGVHSVVCFDGRPAIVDDEIIDIIRERTDIDGFVRSHGEFKQGDQVVIRYGPLKDLVGVFERGIKDTDRIMILLKTVSYQPHLLVGREMVNLLR